MKKIYLFGNWKMNHSLGETRLFAEELSDLFRSRNHLKEQTEFCIFPAFPLIPEAVKLLAPLGVSTGAQNVSEQTAGAFTGEVAPKMLADVGVRCVLVGHSERRRIYGETSELVNLKAKNCLSHHLTPVLCVGETLEDRESGKTFDVIGRQIRLGVKDFPEKASFLVAYEPVWAIGTGRAARSEDAEEVCAFIKSLLNVPVLYGGSVKPSNSAELFSQKSIDGGLIGGASLKASEFLAILESFRTKEMNS
jgi:triosephosphate isomerase